MIAPEILVWHGCAMDTAGELAGDWSTIEAQLPSGWRELAVKHRVMKPVPPQLETKITDPAVLLRLIFHHVALGVSLKVTCAMAAAAALIDLSAVALHLQMRSSGAWLAAMLTQMLDTARTFPAERWSDYEIVIVDATGLTRPGAKGTTARVHYALRLRDLLVAAGCDRSVTPGRHRRSLGRRRASCPTSRRTATDIDTGQAHEPPHACIGEGAVARP